MDKLLKLSSEKAARWIELNTKINAVESDYNSWIEERQNIENMFRNVLNPALKQVYTANNDLPAIKNVLNFGGEKFYTMLNQEILKLFPLDPPIIPIDTTEPVKPLIEEIVQPATKKAATKKK